MKEGRMINMLQGDCMELMAKTPDKYYELACVDPPYNVGASDGTFGGKSSAPSRVTTANGKHYANHDCTPQQEYFDELFRVSKNQIIWGANYYPKYLYHSGWIVWDKLTTGPLSDCELAFQSINKLVAKFTTAWTGFNKGNKEERETERIHPNQKPVNLYRWLLSRYANPGDKILDTHGGSGSICIACHDLGFDLDWIELDEDYYRAAVDRYKRHAAQNELFEFAGGVIND
jgi:site-specific DNA-methyltransferase (adenine-specific)